MTKYIPKATAKAGQLFNGGVKDWQGAPQITVRQATDLLAAFWLTRNGHGAGFWENDYGTEEQCDKLTEACKAFGEFNLYPGDDGRLYGH